MEHGGSSGWLAMCATGGLRLPAGQMMKQDGGRRVIGVVGDVPHGGPGTAGGSEMYLPMRQTGDYAAMRLVVRTALPPDSLAAAIRTALRPLDPNLPVTE